MNEAMRGRYYWTLVLVTMVGALIAAAWVYDAEYKLKIFPNFKNGYVVFVRSDHVRKCDVSGGVTVCYQGWDLKANRPK